MEEVGEKLMNELYHYGVKGMKWGVRRKNKSDKYLDKAVGLIDKAERKADDYYKKGEKALSKQQKLQTKRFDKISELQKQGRNDEINKYSMMSNKEKKLYKKYVDSVNKHVSLKEFAYAYDINITGKMSDITEKDIKRGRNTVNHILNS